MKLVKDIQKYLDTAAENGGVWVSPSGGTHRYAVRILAKEMGISQENAHFILSQIDWLRVESRNPWPWCQGINWDPPGGRFDVSTVIRAVLKFSTSSKD